MWKGRGGVGAPCYLSIDYAFLSRRSIVPAPNIWALITSLLYITLKRFAYLISFPFG